MKKKKRCEKTRKRPSAVVVVGGGVKNSPDRKDGLLLINTTHTFGQALGVCVYYTFVFCLLGHGYMCIRFNIDPFFSPPQIIYFQSRHSLNEMKNFQLFDINTPLYARISAFFRRKKKRCRLIRRGIENGHQCHWVDRVLIAQRISPPINPPKRPSPNLLYTDTKYRGDC